MNKTVQVLKPAPLFRVWDPVRRSFGFSDERPKEALFDSWTGFFDKEGWPIYEQDIISLHYDWKLGWVRALVGRHPTRLEFSGKVTGPDGTVFQVGFYSFADSYLEGNLYQHPALLVPAAKQFPDPMDFIRPEWWSDAIFAAIPRTHSN